MYQFKEHIFNRFEQYQLFNLHTDNRLIRIFCLLECNLKREKEKKSPSKRKNQLNYTHTLPRKRNNQ